MPFPAKTNADAILASATDIIKTGGLTSLSMRTLASRLGVRASSLYRHFPDRSSIERTLALRAADQLLERMRQSTQGLTGERALLAASRAYLDYATTERAFYEMMMQTIVPVPQSSGSSTQIWNFLVALVSDTTNLGLDTAGAAALWSLLHGFTVLVQSGQPGETSSKLSFTRGIQALVRGLAVPEAEAARSPA